MRKFLLAGEWVSSSNKVEIRNPFTGAKVEDVCFAGRKEVEQAIASAVASFPETKKLPSHVRSSTCRHVSDRIKESRRELAELICSESGKPISNCLAEVDRASSTFGIAAEEANRIGGEVIPLDVTKASEGKFGFFSRFPIGVVAGITPFNFPLNLVAHKLAPCLAVGNPFILKPASATPLTALKLAEFVLETQWPKKALSVLPCDKETARPLVEDDRVKLFSFTGSVPVGWDNKKRAGKKKVVLELGGNAGVLIDSGCDLALAAKKCASSAFSYSGQVCISTKRIFVVEKEWEKFSKAFVEEVKKLKVGDPMQEDTFVGSMIDAANFKRISEWVDEAKKAGAKVLYQGKSHGNVFAPVVFTNAPNHLRIVRQEAFGPVVVIEKVKDFESGLKEVNNSSFGLQAGVFTPSLENAFKALRELEVGGVLVNEVPSFRVDNMPYGGVKDSGFGREGVRFAIDDMTEIKMFVVNGVL